MTNNPLTRNKSREIILEVLAPILKSQTRPAGFDAALLYFLLTGPKKRKKRLKVSDPDFMRKMLRYLDLARAAQRLSTVRKPRIS